MNVMQRPPPTLAQEAGQEAIQIAGQEHPVHHDLGEQLRSHSTTRHDCCHYNDSEDCRDYNESENCRLVGVAAAVA
jgi:hypothetical protein